MRQLGEAAASGQNLQVAQHRSPAADLLYRLAEMVVTLIAVAYGFRVALYVLGLCVWGMDRARRWWRGERSSVGVGRKAG